MVCVVAVLASPRVCDRSQDTRCHHRENKFEAKGPAPEAQRQFPLGTSTERETDTQRGMLSRTIPRAQLAFKDLMIH